jgi:hypothetical protein
MYRVEGRGLRFPGRQLKFIVVNFSGNLKPLPYTMYVQTPSETVFGVPTHPLYLKTILRWNLHMKAQYKMNSLLELMPNRWKHKSLLIHPKHMIWQWHKDIEIEITHFSASFSGMTINKVWPSARTAWWIIGTEAHLACGSLGWSFGLETWNCINVWNSEKTIMAFPNTYGYSATDHGILTVST